MLSDLQELRNKRVCREDTVLERLFIRNFKCLENVEIELGNTVVFIGLNNAGKTSALQALALWELGVRRWNEKRRGRTTPEKRPGVTINRRDLVSLPVPDAKLLWHRLHTQGAQGKKVRVEIEVHGIDAGKPWQCGLEFDHANPESIYCRPLDSNGQRMPVPAQAERVQVAYLPPMSGLASNEYKAAPGTVQVLLGEGRTAEVLRNLCYQLFESPDTRHRWDALVQRVQELFGFELEPPEYIPERGEITMAYRDLNDLRLDLSAAGRGLQQTLLVLSYLYGNPGAVVLFDEPDAHLEILRQRQIYSAINEVAMKQGAQIIAASHSEVLLNEAADQDVVVAFVGKPHRIDNNAHQVRKALRKIGFDQYYSAEQTGWVLYLEGSTDLSILKAFATSLDHPAAKVLEQPFVHYVDNQPQRARDHFWGLREAKHDLAGFLLIDHTNATLHADRPLEEYMWQRREIENYLAFPEVLTRFAEQMATEQSVGPLFAANERQRAIDVMLDCIRQRVPPAALDDLSDRYWKTVKASDEFLDLVFDRFYAHLELPNLMRKTDYHRLASLVPVDLIADEVREKLDGIVAVADRAKPVC